MKKITFKDADSCSDFTEEFAGDIADETNNIVSIPEAKFSDAHRKMALEFDATIEGEEAPAAVFLYSAKVRKIVGRFATQADAERVGNKIKDEKVYFSTAEDLEKFSGTELCIMYNNTIPEDVAPVKKFSDKKTAIARVLKLAETLEVKVARKIVGREKLNCNYKVMPDQKVGFQKSSIRGRVYAILKEAFEALEDPTGVSYAQLEKLCGDAGIEARLIKGCLQKLKESGYIEVVQS